MQITKEETGTLTASLKLVVGKEDYEESVTKSLKDYQRKVNMPGFRPGKVPFGLVSKMYRKGVMLDQINHLLAENLQKYIEDNNLKLIGNPLPNKDKAPEIDFDNQSDFEFYFDLGLAPEFQLNIAELPSVDYYNITATEKMIDDQIQEIRHRAAHQELHEHEEGHEETEEHHHEELPVLDEGFYNKVFPGAEIKDEQGFRTRIREMIEQSLSKESERYFMNSAIERLVNDIELELPVDFLRKVMNENDENTINEEEADTRFENFSRSMRWQLIESRIITEYNIHVEEEEMRAVVKSYFTGHLFQNGENVENDERLNKIVDSVLSNKEEATKLHDQLFDQKLLGFFKNQLKLEEKKVDYDEFIKIITKKKA
jgi:FKBP-type peptidyl-prolyl cis-trans isomerase (trigger factor)